MTYSLVKYYGAEPESISADEFKSLMSDAEYEYNGYRKTVTGLIFESEKEEEDQESVDDFWLRAYKNTDDIWVEVPKAFQQMTYEWADE